MRTYGAPLWIYTALLQVYRVFFRRLLAKGSDGEKIKKEEQEENVWRHCVREGGGGLGGVACFSVEV